MQKYYLHSVYFMLLKALSGKDYFTFSTVAKFQKLFKSYGGNCISTLKIKKRLHFCNSGKLIMILLNADANLCTCFYS